MRALLTNKIKEVYKSDLLRVTFWSGISTIVRIISSSISVKITSVILGPSGYAVIGNLNNFSNILMVFATGGVNGGITKYTAEFKEDKPKLASYLSAGLAINLVCAILTALSVILFKGYWSEYVLKTKEYDYVFLILGVSLIIYSINSFLLAIINGLKKFTLFIIINLLMSIIGVAYSLYLTIQFKLEGAIIAGITFQAVSGLITVFVAFKNKLITLDLFRSAVQKVQTTDLLRFSLMALVAACLQPVSQILIRQFITNESGLEAAGLWEGINRISGMYLMVITSSLSIYYLPRLSELQLNSEIRVEIIKIYKLLTPILIFSTVSIYLLRDFIIMILLSDKFEPMKVLFLPQFLGDFFKILSWVLAYNMVAKAQTKLFITTEIIFTASLVLFTYLFLRYFGLIGSVYAYALNYLIYLICMIYIYRALIFTAKSTNE